jgi:DNA-binding MarR family transcriptional regulator
MPKKKKLVPNSGKSISEIHQLPGNTYTAEGVSSLTFTKHYEYFKDINCIYSEEYPEGKMLELLHIVLYCRFKSFQSNGAKCYESQGRLGQIFRSDPGTIGDKIKDLVDMGLVRKDPNPDPNCDTLVYTALDITDAHVIPPDQLPVAPIIVSAVISDQPAQMPAPEPATVEEREVEDVPDCFNSKDDVIPRPTPPMNRMSAACEFLIQNIDHQAEMESFTQFTERVSRNNRNIRLPAGIEDYFKINHPELYNVFDPIPF